MMGSVVNLLIVDLMRDFESIVLVVAWLGSEEDVLDRAGFRNRIASWKLDIMTIQGARNCTILSWQY